ncbi:MAG TPA: caspase family protein [Acidobacteriota bacterium]|nr:caspase family protein [Acidobacteriota bacterium]
MEKNAFSLLVGLKSVDPDAYEGWNGTNGCEGCEIDVDRMESILQPLGYQNVVLKTEHATAENVLSVLKLASMGLKEGDIFVFYFSGHGGQQPDENGDELDGQDETLVLYDGEAIDDELNEIWQSFKPGVRIVMLSDSCNSGTNYRARMNVAESTFMVPLDPERAEMQAEMIHIGGCRDGHSSIGYEEGGVFTTAVWETWAGGEFEGDYREFHEGIKSRITTRQKSQMNEYGPVDENFRDQRPFTI